MARVDGEISIARPVEEVFDLVADERNEPRYNPAMTQVRVLTDGPPGVGTRYAATMAAARGQSVDMTIEVTGFDRPRRLASTTRTPTMLIAGALTFEPDGTGTRLRWRWQLTPRGPYRLLSPLLGPIGRRRELECWRGLKRLMETPGG